MDNNELTPQQQLLVEKLENADQEIDQLLPQYSLGRKFQRPIYSRLSKTATNFLTTGQGSEWIIMAGLRGVGKTTLLAQLYLHPKLKSATRFYLSLDQAQLLGAEMNDVITALEHKLGQPLTQTEEPIFVFLDEVHSLPKWSLTAKILHDRCPKLFLVCTSSSALALWTTPDIARRARFMRVSPLSLPEAIFINTANENDRWHNENIEEFIPNITLGSKIQSALFDSENAYQVYSRIEMLKSEIDHYWKNRDANKDISNYITSYETLPYALNIKHSSNDRHNPDPETINEIRARIRQTLDKVYNHDLSIVGQFDQSTRHHFPSLLLWLANSGQQSLTKMAKRMSLNVRTLQNMLEILVNSEVLIAVPPFGSTSGKIAKPYKYLFTAPAIRHALNNPPRDQLQEAQLDQLRGFLLEDTVGFYMKQTFDNQPLGGLVEYDSSREGADFIVMPSHIKKEAIAVEVGWRKRTSQQVQATLKRIQSNRYGIVITDCNLKLDNSDQIVFVPMKIFLLMQPQEFSGASSLNLNPPDN
ncbi:MAG: AAA family ATPase [Candidatus Saccharibacteria bacterium]|nr:AAA family ATPase [Candidatus Saccharibacteria bacterium]